MIRKRTRKPIRGHRKIRFRELPWLRYSKFAVSILIIGILVYLISSLQYNTDRLSETRSTNTELAAKVSLLTSDLTEERMLMETSLAEKADEFASMKEQLTSLSSELALTIQNNTDLTSQLQSYKTQNDVLRNKLETILGNASRSGSELSPSPVGISGLTLAELQILTKGTTLAGIEAALLQVENDYNCNALYTLAVAKLETGSGTSVLCNTQNNLFGMRASSGWLSYATKSDSVIAFGKLMKSNYFSKGYVTLERIGPRYAEGSTTWAESAKYHMLNDLRKIT